MRNPRLAFAACIAATVLLLPCASAGAQQQPYQAAAVAAADNGEIAVAWSEFAQSGATSIKAAIGTPGAPFGARATSSGGLRIGIGPQGHALAVRPERRA